MGMSSSQARLLSLTSRMHDIEYRAQRTEAQKLQLANESDRVYETYLDALEKKKLVANLVNTDGSMYETELTANHIYSYQQLYEQYALKTAGGKSLIPETLHNAYQSTSSLATYLDSLGLTTSYTQTIHHVEGNPAYTSGYSAWEAAYSQYEADYNAYVSSHAQWEADHASWESAYETWSTTEPQTTEERFYVTSTSTLGADFVNAGGQCYEGAVTSDDIGCYRHVLQHILDYEVGKGYSGSGTSNNSSWYNGTNNKYTTSLGGSATITVSSPSGFCHNESAIPTFVEVSKQVSNETACVASDNPSDGYQITDFSNDWNKLVSKAYMGTDGAIHQKSMRQWAIDLYYASEHYSDYGHSAHDVSVTIVAFQNNLVSNLREFKEEWYTTAHTKWVDEEPIEPIEPTWNRVPPVLDDYVHNVPETISYDETVGHATFKDKDLTQWYANLWCRMEGLYDTPKIEVASVYDSATGTYADLYSIQDIAKSDVTYGTNTEWNTIESDNYIVIPADKMDDPKWISNAVGEGFVLIQQWNSVENKWKDTSPASTSRISEIPDTIDVKKAEAQYEADMRRIDRKDAKYDAELSAFDTERIAIKNEMDTLKTVAKDNVDRTFKLFS